MIKEDFEKRLHNFLQLRLGADKESINHKMNMKLDSWSERELTLVFPINNWQLNPMGHMHGGMIATALDITMGCASYMFSEADHVPTITMNIQYVRPVISRKPLFVKAVVDHIGSRITQIRCIGWQDNEERICVSASGSYIVNKNI